MVNGILQALGSVASVFAWLLARGADLASELWRQAVLAVRFVKNAVGEILSWALTQAKAVFETIVKAIESVGTAIAEVIDWALAAGSAALDLLGEITVRIGNSLSYVLSYIEHDVLPAIAAVIKGALRAGAAIAGIIGWAVERALATLKTAVEALLAAGATIGQLVVATLLHPGDALANLLKALDALGHAFSTIANDVWSIGGEAWERFVLAAKEVGRAVVDILEAALEIVGGALASAVAILLRTLASYREMSAQEKADAALVFGPALDLSDVFVATESLTNDVIFGIQDFFTGNPDSRAFVTDTLINFDVSDGPLERRKMIHELTHVWQFKTTGPFYLVEAIHAQMTSEGYNYGYDEGVSSVSIVTDYSGTTKNEDAGEATGEGGQDDLIAAGGDFDSFNREQQGQILMHWFVRAVLQARPAADVAAWEPYVQAVRAS
jgi:hypothetical protein